MAKAKKTESKKQQSGFLATFDFDNFLPQKYHTLAVILVIFILFLIFLSPLYFGNKTFQSGDILATKSMSTYLEKDREGFSLWNPYIFLGMPAYSIGTEPTWFNLIYTIFTAIRNVFTSFFSVEYSMWSFYLIILGITSFFFMRYLTSNNLVSLFTAIATSFSTGLIVFLFIGHVTKLTSIAFYPLLFLMLFRLREKITLIDILILIITLQLLIQGFHVQIIFYTLFAVAVYFIYYAINALIKKENDELKKLLKSAGVFVFAIIIAALIQIDNFTQIYEYTPYSTRGGKSLVEESTGKAEQSESDYYDYHTNWSFSPGEVLTFVIPSYYGFGHLTYKGPLSNNQEVEVNTYFGQMPFVDVAMYMGVIVFFLALFAIITRWKERLVQYLAILSGLALLISFGKNFPLLFDILFYGLPYFDKFRVPSMMLVIVQLTFPVLAGLGLMKIIDMRNHPDVKAMKLLKYSAYAFSFVLIFFILGNSVINGWFVERVKDYAASISASNQQIAQQFNVLSEFIAGVFVRDGMFAFGFLTITFWFAIFTIQQKFSKDAFVFVIIVLTIFDLWRIDSRGAKYIDNPNIEGAFNPPDYVTAIRNKNDSEPFRILNLKRDGSLGSFNNNGNYHAYFLLEDFYGYSGVKPRAYQDLIDIIGPVNQTLWNMANVKYLIVDANMPIPGMNPIMANDKTIAFENPNVLPRFYFVDSVAEKPAINVLNEIKNNLFNPKEVAFLQEPVPQIDKPDSSVYVKVSKYTDEHITLEVNASGNNFLFIGNTYHPKGWKAEIDENFLQIHRTNHAFMGVVVPQGKHIIELRFAPDSFFISKYISLILSSLVVFGLIGLVVVQQLKRKKAGQD